MANENRLISLDEALKATHNEIYWTESQQAAVRSFLVQQPRVDAEEVVRCKDCKQLMLWCKPTDKVIGECFIRKMNSEDEQFCMVGADDFCSYGEKRADK